MKNRLKWYVNGTDVWGNVRRYKAIFDARITDSIRLYISYNVYMDNSDEWCFSVIQTSPSCNVNKNIKCYDPDVGKKMAEEELQKIFDGMKKIFEERI